MTIFDKDGNKASLNETVNEADEEKIIKEHVASLSKDNTYSMRGDNVDNLYDINRLQMIEAGETKKRKMDN